MKVGFFGGKYLPLHQGHLYLISMAATVVDTLHVVIFTSRINDAKLTRNHKLLDGDLRTSWLGEATADLENIKIHRIDGEFSWNDECDMVRNLIKDDITHVFRGENTYRDMLENSYPEAEHIMYPREFIDISSTKIRSDIYKYWDYIPEAVRKDIVRKIVIVGTESCGKSTLVKYISKIYNTIYVPEVGREYCNRYQDKLTSEMFDDIAMETYLAVRDKCRTANKLLFVDTEAIVTQYYKHLYFNGGSPLIEMIGRWHTYDLILYLNADVEWVDDDLRFQGDPEVRKKNDHTLTDMFDDKNIQFIGGNYTQRLTSAIIKVKNFMEASKRL